MPANGARLIIVASSTPGVADQIANQLQRDGAVAYATHSAAGCLRVATSVRADIVLLDPALPARLQHLLQAHPASAHARILHLTQASIAATRRAAGGPQATPRAPTAAA